MAVDSNTQINLIRQRVIGGLPNALASVAQLHADALEKYARRFMHTEPGPPPPAPNLTDKLYIRTGRLVNSLSPGSEGSETEIQKKGNVVTLRYGTSVVYARVHEFGFGGIRPRPYVAPAAQAMRLELIPIMQKELAAAIAVLWNR